MSAIGSVTGTNLSIARMLIAVPDALALRVAEVLLRAGQLLAVHSAAALLLGDGQAGGAVALVAALGADVGTALERLLAGVAARPDVLRAGRLRLLLPARTRPRQTERALAARARVALDLALVPTAAERLVAELVAAPHHVVAAALRLSVAAHAARDALSAARRALVAPVADGLAAVDAAGQSALALAGAFPRLLNAADRSRARLAAFARLADDLRTRRTRPRMAKQHTAVAAVRVQRLAANLPAGMRHQPRMVLRIRFPSAEAAVLDGNLVRRILGAALRAAPFDRLLQLRNVLALVVVVAGDVALLLHPLQRSAVPRPSLHAVHVEEAVAVRTRPDLGKGRSILRIRAERSYLRSPIASLLQCKSSRSRCHFGRRSPGTVASSSAGSARHCSP